MPSLNRTVNGLILQEDFSSANGWTSGTGWSRVAKPAMVQFGELADFVGPTAGSGSSNYMGNTVSQPFIDTDGSWYIFAYGGNFGDGNSGFFFSKSTDRGVTWSLLGTPDNLWWFDTNTNFSSGGRAGGGWIEKRGSRYIMHRICSLVTRSDSDTWLPGNPQYGDIWTNDTANILTGWTFQSRLAFDAYNPNGPNYMVIPICVWFDGASTYYRFFQSYPNNSTGYSQQWVATSSAALGPWTLNTTVQVTSSQLPDSTIAIEALRVHYNATLGKYVGLMNGLTASGTGAGGIQNIIFIADTITGWPTSTNYIFQRMPGDANASSAIGIPTHFTKPDGAVQQELGYVAFAYDGNGRETSPTFERGRHVLGGVLEPSANVAHFSDVSGTRFAYSRTQSNTNFTAEFSVCFAALATGADVSFEYRSNGTTGYRLVVRGDAAHPRLLLQKMDGTTIQDNTTGILLTQADVLHRIKVTANGTQQSAWLDGEQQINVTDATYSTGTQIAFSAKSVTADVRLFHIRTGDTVTIKSLPTNTTVNIRSLAEVPVAQVVSDSNGVATYTGTHFPVSRVDVPGSTGDAQTSDSLLWGGDTVIMAGFGWLRLAVAGLLISQAQLTALQTAWQGVTVPTITQAQIDTVQGILNSIVGTPNPPPTTDVQVPRDGATLKDASGGVWSLGSAAIQPYGNAILRNGAQMSPQQPAWGVLIEYTNGRLTHVNGLGQRYLWNGASTGTVWSQTSTP